MSRKSKNSHHSKKEKVFINCPFDNRYKPMLKVMLFGIIYFELEPVLCTTTSSANYRLDVIKELVKSSKYSIHDLSRCRNHQTNVTPRFNMPFELGLDLGWITYGGQSAKSKKILILEKERYFYQEVLSDIAGQDISEHDDNPLKLLMKVRNFIAVNRNAKFIDSHDVVWKLYCQFTYDLEVNLLLSGMSKSSFNTMTVTDFILFSNDWIKVEKARK